MTKTDQLKLINDEIKELVELKKNIQGEELPEFLRSSSDNEIPGFLKRGA